MADSGPEVPEIVKYLESRQRRGFRTPRRRFAQRFSLPALGEPLIWTVCFWLPNLYAKRHQELVTVVRAEPDIYTNDVSREGATTAWAAYCESMVNEWESANVITALILGAVGSFLALPGISDASRYALLFSLLSSLASIAHAVAYAHIYRSKLSNRHFSIIQLTTYLTYYCYIDNVLLCIPLINTFYAIGAFAVSIIAYLWPNNNGSGFEQSTSWRVMLAGRILVPTIFGFQVFMIAVSWWSSQALTFSTDELLDAGRARELELRMKEEKAEYERQAAVIENMLVVNEPKPRRAPLPRGRVPVRWLRYSATVTEAAVPLGYEDGNPDPYLWDHQKLYVVRIFYDGRYRVGKLGWHIGNGKFMYIPYSKTQSELMLPREQCDILCGDNADFAWFRIREGEQFDVSRAAAEVPDPYELFVANPTGDEGAEWAYVCAAEYSGGVQLGEVTDGARHANIPWIGDELHITPFLVLLIRRGALISRDTVVDDLATVPLSMPSSDGPSEKATSTSNVGQV